jgi:hypothetical protein
VISPVLIAAATALLMAGLLIEACIFRALHSDAPSTYKLYAVRDHLMRLVVDGKIARNEPHFDALYCNVNILLKGCRRLSGQNGWSVAKQDGRHLARHPDDHVELAEFPRDSVPKTLVPVLDELRVALQHVVANHFGLSVVMNERRRELGRMQKERARELLSMMPNSKQA